MVHGGIFLARFFLGRLSLGSASGVRRLGFKKEDWTQVRTTANLRFTTDNQSLSPCPFGAHAPREGLRPRLAIQHLHGHTKPAQTIRARTGVCARATLAGCPNAQTASENYAHPVPNGPKRPWPTGHLVKSRIFSVFSDSVECGPRGSRRGGGVIRPTETCLITARVERFAPPPWFKSPHLGRHWAAQL